MQLNKPEFGSESKIAGHSFNNLVPVSSRGSLFEKRNTYKKFIVLLIAFVIILLLAFVILLVLYILNGSYNNYSMCTSDECLRSAANLKLSMNLAIDPCEDFYKFTCGRWSKEHPNHGWFSHYSSFETVDEHIAFATMRFFKSNESDNEPLPVKQSRYLYKSCMDTDSANKLGYSVIYDYLKIVGLPLIPSLFESESNETYKFDWIITEAKIRKTFSMDTLIGFTVDANIYNRNETVIYIGRPSISSQLPRYIRKKEKVLHRNRRSHIEGDLGDEAFNDENYRRSTLFETAKIVTKSVVQNISVLSTTDSQIEDAAELLWSLKHELDELNEHNYTEDENLDYESFKVDELQKLTENCVAADKRNLVKDVWRKYLTTLFDDVQNVTLDLDGNTLLYVSYLEMDYLCDIMSFITNTSDRALEYVYWWTIVDNMIGSTTSDIAESLWSLASEYDNESVERPRSIDCAALTVNYMGVAVSYGIADIAALNFSIPKVDRMINDIKNAFLERVREITWMDEKTKRATLEKSREMVSFIGYPKWFLKNGTLEEYYGNITIREDTYLENMMNIIKLYTPYRLSQLGKESIRQWRTDPITVNAYNYFSDNSITVPMAILTFPFYNLGLEVLNYGAIGTILGHELTHGFDITGRKFDKYGNYKQWWSENTIEAFVKKTDCFVKQYDNFTVPSLTKRVSGYRTLAENLADNGGFHHAYWAYQRHKANHLSEKILPGFQHFSENQLFFIAYGSIWCEEFNANAIKKQIETDEHSPNYIRVMATLQNSKEFAEAFNCPLGSKMNPAQEKCRVW
ncbi:endothelin-converting enzyme homolog isoform X2 [Agrilus planipennis]|uniref:Endothelin-converting enzyme homolog isoform X2 n=1 Tax=Agrilus planipennis TaxID=224129 RepID=A0A1W4WHQ1_AGRPL|nr:endothelin-converting enzyme homolog isoform X2 [Agrilus planipennis]